MTASLAHRIVAPEWLDELSPGDPEAIGSRRDLRRLNFWMGNARTMRRAIAESDLAGSVARMAELGAGDGNFLLSTVGGLAGNPGRKVYLVDRRPSVSSETIQRIKKAGWELEIAAADVFDWLPGQRSLDLVIANLFLHHFENDALADLLRLVSERAKVLIACEPRRAALPLAAGRMLRLLGCNGVTRHDAPISVRAGFRGTELSAAWPARGWKLREERAGLFTHLFIARKAA